MTPRALACCLLAGSAPGCLLFNDVVPCVAGESCAPFLVCDAELGECVEPPAPDGDAGEAGDGGDGGE